MHALPAAMVAALAAFAPLFSARVWGHAQVLLAGAILARRDAPSPRRCA